MYCYPIGLGSISIEQFKTYIETDHIGNMLARKMLYGEFSPDFRGADLTRISQIRYDLIGFRIDRFIYTSDSVKIFIEPVDTPIGRLCRRMLDESFIGCMFIPRLFMNKDTGDDRLITIDMYPEHNGLKE